MGLLCSVCGRVGFPYGSAWVISGFWLHSALRHVPITFNQEPSQRAASPALPLALASCLPA